MKWIVLIFGVRLFALALPCSAAEPCRNIAVKASLAVAGGEVSLADLLEPTTCAGYRKAAAGMSLGAAPLAGTVRVLDGGEVRRRVAAIAEANGLKDEIVEEVPAKIVVQRQGGKKSCPSIAEFALQTLPVERRTGISQASFDCAAAWSVPEGAALQAIKTAWSSALQRWEFSLRCMRSADCVPFLVWAPVNHEKTSSRAMASVPIAARPGSSAPRQFSPAQSFVDSSVPYSGTGELIKPGQTAMLRWDEGGIRIVLPVTCLDGGALGETVRVRFKNAGRILRAEILSDGSLRAGL